MTASAVGKIHALQHISPTVFGSGRQEKGHKTLTSIKVGVLQYRIPHYSYQRTILNRVPDCKYVGVGDIFSYLRAGVLGANQLTRANLLKYFNLNNLFNDLGLNKVDLLHLFNGVDLSKRHRWVTSFETIVPRLTTTLEPRDDRGIRNPAFTGLNGQAFRALADETC